MNILIISAHPDDLKMSCGGAVAKWVKQGHTVINLVMSPSVDHIEYVDDAQKYLGYEVVGWPGDRESLKISHTMIADIESHFSDIEFDRIITHWKEDSHQEHRLCFELGNILARSATELWYMSSHPYHLKYREFSPDIYVDISDHSYLKYKALDAYENIPDRWNVGVRSHDAWRGTFIDKKRAEVFQAGHVVE